ncbi:LINE-1 reverse transcriptase like [Trifolium medium]|uniref:LINE-1 reverse transcriptase like n=1 Tax=Trifolium medium TaxID=97028 RepID=A0A392M2T1_9FABA|nr:LINE-1 reverse transcriptase like [Trifolium medium]
MAKRRRLSSLLKSGAFDMCFLQETKRDSFDDFMIHNVWGHKDVEWVAKESRGLSGGLLTVWNAGLFTFHYSFTGDGFLGVCGEWKASLVYFVNIYSSCSLSGKRKLWNDLLEFKLNNTQGDWCLGGDFNAVLKVGERRGRRGGGGQVERTEFAQFIDAMEVVDIPVTGKKFSWFSSDGSAMSRLDRFLLSEGFIDKGGISNQWIGDRDISDHCPISLVSSNLDWGPKPFKFNNCWLEHPDFFSFVADIWKKTVIRGKKAFILKEKLKILKENLKVWNREVFGILDLNINKTVKELNEVEDLVANGIGDSFILKSKELDKKFWEQIHYKESLLHQKSRTNWIQEGDSNTRYFHASIKGRRRRNQIVMLHKGEEWIQGVDCIKKEVKDHFSKHFSEEWSNRPFLQEEEVKDVIWSCDGNKSPGPDGFNLNFFKACWSIVKDDVMAFLREFHVNSILPKAVTASFLTLIPKKDHPQDLFYYRPICLIGSLYKILSKILANRLKCILGKLISNCQSAFLPHRQILDGVLVLNEILDLTKRRKDECFLFKVDFERAYDTVHWGFLERMMSKMGFSDGWIKWM